MELVERIATLNVSQAIVKVLRRPEVQKEIVRLNTEVQLFDLGENALGIKLSAIGGAYTPFTKAIKQAKGQPTDRVTLRDTGEFYQSFKISILPNGDFDIVSDPIKDDTNLLQEWGKEVEGLNKENHKKVLDIIENAILDDLFK